MKRTMTLWAWMAVGTLMLLPGLMAAGSTQYVTNQYNTVNVMPNAQGYSDYVTENQQLTSNYNNQYLKDAFAPSPSATPAPSEPSTLSMIKNTLNPETLKPLMYGTDESMPALVDVLRDEEGTVYAVMYQNVKKTIKNQDKWGITTGWMAEAPTKDFDFPLLTMGAYDSDHQKWVHLGTQGLPDPQDQVTHRADTQSQSITQSCSTLTCDRYGNCRTADSKYSFYCSATDTSFGAGGSAAGISSCVTSCVNAYAKITMYTKEYEDAGTSFMGAVPAPGKGIYVFYENKRKRWMADSRQASSGYNTGSLQCYSSTDKTGYDQADCPGLDGLYTYHTLAFSYELRVMTVTKDGVQSDDLVASSFSGDPSGAVHNLVFLGALKDKYYYCISDYGYMAYSQSTCSKTSSPDLYVSNGIHGTPVKIGVYGTGSDYSFTPYRKLLLSPDGNVFALQWKGASQYDFLKGTVEVYSLNEGTFQKTQSPGMPNFRVSTYGDVWYGNYPQDNYMYSFDPKGNLYLAYPTVDDASGTAQLYFQLIPQSKLAGKTEPTHKVELYTTSSCDACDKVRKFLSDHGVAFEEISPDKQTQDHSAAVFPTTRVTDESGEVSDVQGMDPIGLAAHLGLLLDPTLVEKYGLVGTLNTWGSFLEYPSLQPSIYLDSGEKPFIIIQQKDYNLVSLSPNEDAWDRRVLFKPDSQISGFLARPLIRVVNGPPIQSVDDLAIFTKGEPVTYQTGKVYNSRINVDVYSQAPFSYEDTQAASQVVPGAVFWIPLQSAPDSDPSYYGSLKDLIVDQGVVTDGGQLYYRIKVDLNKAGVKAHDGMLTPDSYDMTVTIGDTYAHLTLDVKNQPLGTYDANSPDDTVQIGTESAKTPDGQWVVANNLALPDVLDCGSNSIELAPNAYKTFASGTLDDATSACLEAYTNEIRLAGTCNQWTRSQDDLVGETIDAYNHALPAQVPYSDYVDFFGNAQATVYRVVPLDTFVPAETTPDCTPSLASKNVMVLQLTGDIISTDESEYNPEVKQLPVVG